jgi:hypothetical protein
MGAGPPPLRLEPVAEGHRHGKDSGSARVSFPWHTMKGRHGGANALSTRKYYGAPVSNSFSLVEDNNKDISQLSQCENNIFTANLSKKEVFKIFSQMEYNKAPGLDGFPAEVYQTFWDVINNDFTSTI